MNRSGAVVPELQFRELDETCESCESLENVITVRPLRKRTNHWKVTRAAVWLGVGYAGGQTMRLIGNVILYRLLFPEAFGIMALVQVLLQGLEMFSDVGIGPSIIQHRRGDEPAFLNTAWTVQVGRGFLLWFCSLALAWPAAQFYGQPQLLWLIPLVSLSAVIAGFNSTSLYCAKRHLQLDRLAIFDLSVQFLSLLVMCVWAWLKPSLLALPAGLLVGVIARSIGSHLVLPGETNRFQWEPEAWKAVIGFGKWIFASSLISFLAMQADRLILGKLVSSSEMGVYNIAATIALIPQVMLLTICGSLFYPVLSKHARSSAQQMTTVLYPARDALLAASLALVLGVYSQADLFFSVLYDARYQLAAPITKMLLASIWVTILGTTLEPVFHSKGDSRSTAIAGVVRVICTLIGTLVGFQIHGIWGFIAGLLFGASCGYAALTICLRRHGIWLLRQDLRNTAIVGCLALLVSLGDGAGPVRTAALSLSVCFMTAAWAASKSYRLARLHVEASLSGILTTDSGQLQRT